MALDHKRLVYQFDSSLSPNVVLVNLYKIDFFEGSGVRVAAVEGGDVELVGDIDVAFKPSGYIRYIKPRNDADARKTRHVGLDRAAGGPARKARLSRQGLRASCGGAGAPASLSAIRAAAYAGGLGALGRFSRVNATCGRRPPAMTFD